MTASELRVANRTYYFRKAVSAPQFESERVLARDAFQFGLLWLRRHCKEAVPYWEQARSYFVASTGMSAEASPLTSYYCFLNAAKALLIVKGQSFSDAHGVSGEFEASKRSLINEVINFKGSGVVAALSSYLGESDSANTHTLKDILANLPFIHRAFRHTYTSHREMFIPLRSVVYRKHPKEDRVWLSAHIDGRFADARTIRTFPGGIEKDNGFTGAFVIRTKKRVEWFSRGASAEVRREGISALQRFHKRWRRRFVYISSSPVLWYLKRDITGAVSIDRYNMTLIIAAMHRLSELSRYDPSGLRWYLEKKENWLLTEFIELAPTQFIDELVCEMTDLEFAIPGVRP